MKANQRAAAIDSQSVKTREKRGEVDGFDGGKGVKGRKCHILVDTMGLLWEVIVTEANGSQRVNESLIYIAMIHLMLKRITKEKPPQFA